MKVLMVALLAYQVWPSEGFVRWWQDAVGTVRVTEEVVQLGTEPVRIRTHEREKGLTFFSMHDDENASVEAGVAMVRKHGGRLIEVVHRGRRNIVFKLDGVRYEFDPNRIFTDAGIEATLRNGRHPYSEAAHMQVRLFADALLRSLKLDALEKNTLVALHNNSPGAYSLASYAIGNLQREAKEIHENPQMDVDDFFFVTRSATFRKLKAKDMNVVLQDGETMTDDGSLSVFCETLLREHGRDIFYINVEAEDGAVERQTRMLELLH
jgi:hypothetical protein